MQKNESVDSAFDQLKSLLLSEDWQHFREIRDKVDALANEVHDKDQLIETLDPVIADLLDRKIHESRDEMAEALAPIMGDAIKVQVNEAREDIVDALYPVIGSMVSKAINEAMRKLVASINEQINHAMNNRLMMHFKTRVLKIQPAAVVLAEGVAFQLNDLFLIEKKSGLLIGYQGRDSSRQDNEAHVLGGMLTAIRQFVNDAFPGNNSGGELLEIQHEEQCIRLDSGRYTYLAAVYQGVSPHDFPDQMHRLHHHIHNRYYKKLREYQGSTTEFQGVAPMMNRLFKKYRMHVTNL